MYKCFLVALFTLSFILLNIFFPQFSFAHPGNTAADGCHYCRTNCTKWGEIEGARHCHGGQVSVTEIESVPLATTAPTIKPAPKTTQVFSPRPDRSAKPAVIQCSATVDSSCPAQCTAGNDADCCTSKLSGYSWYDNWGCYPTKSSCSAARDNVCDKYCTAGNDHDCCLHKEGYTWYDNWGCYPI